MSPERIRLEQKLQDNNTYALKQLLLIRPNEKANVAYYGYPNSSETLLALGNWLASNDVKEVQILFYGDISAASLGHFSQCMAQGNSVEILVICGIHFDDEKMEQFTQHLSACTSLSELHIRDRHMSNQTLSTLLTILKQCPSLWRCNIEVNSLDEDAKDIYADFIENNTVTTWMTLPDNGFNQTGMLRIFDALKKK